VKKVCDLPGRKHDPPEEVCSSYLFLFAFSVLHVILGNDAFEIVGSFFSNEIVEGSIVDIL
jgi:hypothetical protein